MAKNKSDGEASAEAAKRRPQKKAAPRPGAKNRPSRPAKGGARPGKPPKPARGKKPEPRRPAEPTQVELPISSAGEDPRLAAHEDIEDAEILAETSAGPAVEVVALDQID